MNLYNMLLLVIMFNLASGAVNVLAVTGYTAPTSPALSPHVIAQAAGCTQSAGAMNCTTPSLNGFGGLLATAMVFGDWFGATIVFVLTFAAGMALPGYFLLAWGVAPAVAVMVSGGVWFTYLMFILSVRSGRYMREV